MSDPTGRCNMPSLDTPTQRDVAQFTVSTYSRTTPGEMGIVSGDFSTTQREQLPNGTLHHTRSIMAKPRSVAIVNQKGGVQKTTTTVNVSHGVALRGHHVLNVDLDQQKSSLTTWAGGDQRPDAPEIANVILGEAKPADAIVASTLPGVDLIRSSITMVDAEEKLKNKPGRDLVLSRLIDNLPDGYDYVFFDCPGRLSPIVLAALVAVDEVIIPIRAQGMSLEAIDETLQIIDEIVEATLRKARPRVWALVTEYDGRLRQAREVLSVVQSLPDVRAFTRPARRNEAGSEAFNQRQSIFQYDPGALVASDYEQIITELIDAGPHS